MINYNLRIETLSPVHIGSGTALQPFEYYEDNSILYKLRIDKCFDFVFNNDARAIDKFDEWINTEITRQVHRIGQKEYYGIFNFVGKTLNNPQLLEQLCSEIKTNPKYYEYKIPIAKIERNKNIKQLLKTASNEVYLPGSSIKGMLRTALLNYVLSNNQDYQLEISKKISNQLSGRIDKNKVMKDFELDFILGSGFNKNGYTDYSDAKYDLFKFIHFTDTDSYLTSEHSYVVQPNIKKIVQVNNEQKIDSQPLDAIEAVKPGTVFNSRITIDTAYIKKIAQSQDDDTWKNFRNRFERVFGNGILDKSEKEIGQIIVNTFEDAIINQQYVLVTSDSDWIDRSNIFNNVLIFLNSIEENDLKIKLGFGSTFWSKTVSDAFIQNNVKEYIALFNNLGLGSNRKNPKPVHNFENFPKTRTIVNDGRTNHLMGWVDLSFEQYKSR